MIEITYSELCPPLPILGSQLTTGFTYWTWPILDGQLASGFTYWIWTILSGQLTTGFTYLIWPKLNRIDKLTTSLTNSTCPKQGGQPVVFLT
jgi:hypothetical protein